MNVQTAISADKKELLRAAREEAYSTPLKDYHPGAPRLFQNDTLWPWFERLRNEEPVHYCTNSPIEPYWSVTKYNDIMHVDTNHGIFSSDSTLGGISIRDVPPGYDYPSFIAMDQPRHSAQRKTVSPMFTPTHLDELAKLIRQRSQKVLDDLPRNETFNFVERVSIELTTQMLATLFDFPWEERRKLTRWSNVATAAPGNREIIASEAAREAELQECGAYFEELWKERIKQPPKADLLSMMAHSEATRDMDPKNFLGNLILLIVGGNDTTRNSLSGSVYALNLFPDQYRKLREDHALVQNLVPEVIRWQTPLAHMRRTALTDTEIAGKAIKKGEKVVMWYVSGNRDEDMFENADDLLIERRNARNHIAFGFGIHRCLGLRLAELQLRIVWQEILERFDTITVVDDPKWIYSNFVKGYETLPVRIAG